MSALIPEVVAILLLLALLFHKLARVPGIKVATRRPLAQPETMKEHAA